MTRRYLCEECGDVYYLDATREIDNLCEPCAARAAKETPEEYSARVRAEVKTRLESVHPRCPSCRHPEHWGLCSARSGGTAYACMCSKQPEVKT